MTVHLTSSTFDEFIGSSNLPVVVDFWAPWCGPCKLIGPTIDYLDQQETKQVNFAKVDIDQHPELAVKFDLKTIPALLLFKSGEFLGRISPNGYSGASITESIRTALAERGL